ncbi:MAG: ribbon-helix-helix domain-containing protein [Candidatus Bathyarchaeia archaeon]
MTKKRKDYSSVSLPIKLLEEVNKLIKELGFWPSASAFVREAVVQRIERLRGLREEAESDERSVGP